MIGPTPPGAQQTPAYTDEFKAEMVAICQGLGLTVAAVAVMHKVSAHVVRCWLERVVSGATTTGSDIHGDEAVSGGAHMPSTYFVLL